MRIQAILAVFCLLAPINASAHHQFANENLVEILPSGFILGSQSSSGALKRTEFVPQAETVNGWSELITTDVFFGRKNQEPASFLSQMGERWLASCPGSRPDIIHTGQANGYAVSMLLLRCEKVLTTGMPENTLVRAIAGNDSFYVVQYAFRLTLSADKLSRAANFLASVNVCDTRSASHPCPRMKGNGPPLQ